MIPLKITRDEARELVDFFFPLLDEICQVRIRDAKVSKDDDAGMVGRMVLCLFRQVDHAFKKKLLTKQKTFTIQLSEAEGICLYQLLMAFPIDERMEYEIWLRQKITDFLDGHVKL
jgi:hypothetical protein